MKLLIVGDVHLADRPPSLRTEHYTDEVFAKLAECNALAKEHGVDAIVQAGDLFHIKAPSRNSHAMVHRFITDVLENASVPWLCCWGNHDVTHDREESLPNQPLGVLFQSGLIRLEGEVSIGDGTVFGIPWRQDWSTLPQWMERWDASTASLMVTHASIFPNGDSPPYEHFSADEWAAHMKRDGDVFYGHIHGDYGTFESSDGRVTFCNHGALTRGSLAEHDVSRQVKVTLYES